LLVAENRLRCANEACGAAFPCVAGAPILINEATSIFDTAGFERGQETFFKPVGRARKWASERLPDLSGNVAAEQALARFRALLKEAGDRPRVLVIGGGVVGAGLDDLLSDGDFEIVETDAALGERTQLICDAHDLPFRDEVFDGVIVQAVLEHVVDPHRCVAEIQRVLRPGGLVYSDTPFIQQVHGREFDFTRFTRLGHRRLFREFDEVASGISCGPGMALAWTIRYFLMSFFASTRLRALASALARLGFFWLKYLDPYLARKPGALDAASAFYFLGSKGTRVLSDRELVASYQGGF
jgi:SAM-dependent methyltransferase